MVSKMRGENISSSVSKGDDECGTKFIMNEQSKKEGHRLSFKVYYIIKF